MNRWSFSTWASKHAEKLATPYLPRRPQETVLYGLVKEHWRDFVQHAREAYEAPLPKCLFTAAADVRIASSRGP